MHYNIWVESESLESLSPGIQKYCQSERRWKQHKRRPPGLSICSRLELRKGNKRRKRRRRRKKISFLWSFIPIPRVRLPVITTLDFFCRVFFCEKKNERGRYHLSLSLSPRLLYSLAIALQSIALSRRRCAVSLSWCSTNNIYIYSTRENGTFFREIDARQFPRRVDKIKDVLFEFERWIIRRVARAPLCECVFNGGKIDTVSRCGILSPTCTTEMLKRFDGKGQEKKFYIEIRRDNFKIRFHSRY